MNVVAIYRLYPEDNRKDRPPYYSKPVALASFLKAWDALEEPKKLFVAVDATALPSPYQELLGGRPDAVWFTGGIGNGPAYRTLLLRLDAFPSDSLLYFAEDDYLYCEEAFVQFREAARAIPEASYFTLYDHRDRYTRGDDAWRVRERVFVAGDRHWRTVESTCMTFGARTEVLRRDRWIHRLLTPRSAPKDRLIWRCSQGIGQFFWRYPKRMLIGPIPSLSTHADQSGLAPLIDWEGVAGDARAHVERVTRTLS